MRGKVRAIVIASILMLIFTNLIPEDAVGQPEGWSDDIFLTVDDDIDSRDPCIGINSNLIHVVWEDQRHYASNAPEIYYRNSTDGGKTWNPEMRLTNIESLKLDSKIAVNGSNIHVVWIDDRDVQPGNKIYYMNSTDGGKTWSAERRISSDISDCADVDIAVNGSNIHVTYSDDSEDGGSDEQLFYVNSTDNGLTWSSPRRLISTIRYTFDLAIDVYLDNIHIVWSDAYDKDANPGGIFYINSTDNGISWSEEQNLTPPNGPSQSVAPYIAVNNGNIHVIFGNDRTGTMQIYYKRSEDNGITWSDDTLLTNNPEGKSRPEIEVYKHNISVIWSDLRDGNWEIYYRNSSDNGYNWNNNTRLTYDDGYSGSPNFVVDKNEVDVVWMDKRDNEFEIYYKHYPVPSPPTNLTIDIWENNLTLNWTAPQNSPSPVDHYLIYRSTTWNGFDFSFPWVNTSLDDDNGIIPLRTSWNDTIALLDENNNYFYVVRAIDADGWNDTNMNIVGKYMIQLKAGWNLFSVPLAQRDTTISVVLESIDGNYDVVKWYDAKDGVWHSYESDLTDLNRTMGLWIYMNNKCNLSVVGAVPDSTDIALYEGWNMVGYPSLETRNLIDALSGVSWESVWHYDAFDDDPWKHNHTSKPYRMNDLEEMRPGGGYWVYVTIDDTWISTRIGEDMKMVVWRIRESEENDDHRYISEITGEKSGGTEEENQNEIETAPGKVPFSRKENRIMVFSLTTLIILMVLIIVCIKIFWKRNAS